MPQRLFKGRDRFDYKGDPEFIDALKETAAEAEQSLTDWLWDVLSDALRRAGKGEVVERCEERRRQERFAPVKRPKKGRRG